jgi:hypothetical protein
MAKTKQASFDLPKGMLDGVDRFIGDNPQLGFERAEFIKAAVREYLIYWEGGKVRQPQTGSNQAPQEIKDQVKVDDPKGQKTPSEKILRIIADTLAYDRMWADGLDKEDDKLKGSNPKAYYSSIDHMRGEQRITMKNIDQFIILDKVLEEDLTKAEIEVLGIFLKHYARNYKEIDQKTKKPV